MRSIFSSLGSICLTLCCVGGALFGQVQEVQAIAMHEPTTTPESAYIEFADTFPSVGWMFGIENGQDVAFSSGVLIDEHWVLTSAHGVLGNDNDPSSTFESFEFGLGSNVFTDPGESLISTEVFVNPNYGGPESGPDLALLYFEDAFQSASPANLYTGDVSSLEGTESHIVGFGNPGTPATGPQPIDAQKRAGTNIVEGSSSVFEQSFFRQPGHPDFVDLGVLGTPGDSGGGVVPSGWG